MCSLGSRTPTPYPGSLRRSIPKNRFPWSFDPPQGFNCDASSAEIVGLLLDNGADANPRAEPGSTPLMAACRNGCLEIVKLLIARGAEVNGQNKFGMTALDMACSEANSEIVKFLLENGANVATEWDKEGHVSLHMGTWVFCPEVTKAILAKHIDRKADFGTILHFASFVGQTETVRLLLEYGGNINARDRIGFATLLQEAHETSWADFVASANKAYDISALSRNEWYRTYQRGKRHWLFELIDYSGSDRAPCTGVSDVQTIGATALHWASLGGQPEVVRLLLANGADPKAVDDEGHSALHVACAIHNPEVAKLLIDNGANVNQKDRKERTPLAWALNTAGSGPFWSTAGGVYSVDNEAGVSGLRWADIHCDFSESNYKKLIELLKAAGAEK
ncbi:MAG: ankyrin repeat domain-containing protein [Desulfomonile tiedjei]|uniref:Ankyrin repeat domain-containing protein n=1 Tax=Desulfomonile tiedjei TaxID=2358 RepID=A0A9D6V6B3_9BACT|nr:ankyrin repeat domain-containing protein [Desulfomonile tiedjei]